MSSSGIRPPSAKKRPPPPLGKGLRTRRFHRPGCRADQPLLLLPQLHGRVVPQALVGVYRGDRAPRAAQPYPVRMRSRQSLIQRAQRWVLSEDGDLEVVAAESPDAAPPGERIDLEQQRPAQRRVGVHLVPPAVLVGGGD